MPLRWRRSRPWTGTPSAPAQPRSASSAGPCSRRAHRHVTAPDGQHSNQLPAKQSSAGGTSAARAKQRDAPTIRGPAPWKQAPGVWTVGAESNVGKSVRQPGHEPGSQLSLNRTGAPLRAGRGPDPPGRCRLHRTPRRSSAAEAPRPAADPAAGRAHAPVRAVPLRAGHRPRVWLAAAAGRPRQHDAGPRCPRRRQRTCTGGVRIPCAGSSRPGSRPRRYGAGRASTSGCPTAPKPRPDVPRPRPAPRGRHDLRQDVPSADDETIEESGVFGLPPSSVFWAGSCGGAVPGRNSAASPFLVALSRLPAALRSPHPPNQKRKTCTKVQSKS